MYNVPVSDPLVIACLHCGEIRSGRTVAREPVQGQSFDALAAAHNQALATMSADIAAAVRAEAEKKS